MTQYRWKFWGFTENDCEPPYLLRETESSFKTEMECVIDARKHYASLRFPFMIMLSVVTEPVPRHPFFETMSSRLASYQSWPPCMPFKPKEAAEAGFFYTGKADQVTCYSCGESVKQWEQSDKPRSVHKKRSPNCFHLSRNESALSIGSVLADSKRKPVFACDCMSHDCAHNKKP